jgi:hypothetical protein
MLAGLRDEGFTDEQVLFAYRTFNSFLLGFLLLETSAAALRDPKPGDGSFQAGADSAGTEPVGASDPVPGGLSPTRRRADRRKLVEAESPAEGVDPFSDIDRQSFPNIRRLGRGLTADRYDAEFESGLRDLLERIERFLAQTAGRRRRGRGLSRS